MKKPFEERDEEQNQEASEKRIFTYAKKVKTYFSTEPQKEKVLRHEDFSAAGDVYYAHVSASYKIAQRTLLVILVVFILFSVFINRHEITYDNFFYLMKDFSSAAGNEQNHYETLSYESDSRQKFALYRGCSPRSRRSFLGRIQDLLQRSAGDRADQLYSVHRRRGCRHHRNQYSDAQQRNQRNVAPLRSHSVYSDAGSQRRRRASGKLPACL